MPDVSPNLRSKPQPVADRAALQELFRAARHGFDPEDARQSRRCPGAGGKLIGKSMYHLTVDGPDKRSIVLALRTDEDGVMRGRISLPVWYELPETWDGPHDAARAVHLANDYAEAYGYHAVAADIESSQPWDPAWGELQVGNFL